MRRVLVRAPLLTNSGYGVHSRQLFSWLLEKSKNGLFSLTTECLNWGNCPWYVDPNLESGLIGEIMNRSVQIEPKYDVTFQIQLPDEWKPELGKYNVGVTAAVETDKCNPKWVEKCNEMDLVVVPSTFTKNVIKRSGIVTTEIKVIPEWYHKEIDDNPSGLNLRLPTEFNFLTVGLLTHNSPDLDRKNIFNTLAWFCEHFKENKEVGLIVKTSLGKLSSFDRKQTDQYFRSIIKSVRHGEYPKIYLLHGGMTNREISALYRSESINGYVTLTRGEGYGLPIIEAAASGLPIIATNHSGHLQFLRNGTFLPVDYKMISTPEEKNDNRIFLSGFKWAEPSKESYFTSLDELYNNYKIHKDTAEGNSEYIRENFSRESIIKIYNKVFEEVL